jgi:hypothetical protein
MSSQEYFEYDIPENNMTAPECLKATADDIFDEASIYLKGVFYEDRLIELMHLKPKYAADESNPHVIYKAYGLVPKKLALLWLTPVLIVLTAKILISRKKTVGAIII